MQCSEIFAVKQSHIMNALLQKMKLQCTHKQKEICQFFFFMSHSYSKQQ